jgi:hypothetical protein
MNQIYYNFVRLHMELDGETPAEVAGICIDNGWMVLIRKSTSKINK